MPDRTLLTAARLRELLHYDPDTGIFTWRVTRGSARPGGIAGHPGSGGYLRVGIYGVGWQANRLAWLYMTGEHPMHEVDHINGVRVDNCWSNLRAATSSQNQQNMRRAMVHNSTGLLGVSYDKSRGAFLARIRVNGRLKHLGRFTHAQDAHAAYLAAKRDLHPYGTL